MCVCVRAFDKFGLVCFVSNRLIMFDVVSMKFVVMRRVTFR